MMIEKMSIKNFGKFEELNIDFSSQMNIICGNNSAGKSTVLKALAVGISSFFIGIDGVPSPDIRTSDVRFFSEDNDIESDIQPKFTVFIECSGEINNEKFSCIRSLYTDYENAEQIKNIALNMYGSIKNGSDDVILPLIAYYGSDRFRTQKMEKQCGGSEEISNRFDGYRDCLPAFLTNKPKIRKTMVQNQESTELPELLAIKSAIEERFNIGSWNLPEVDVQYDPESDTTEIIYTEPDGNKHIVSFNELDERYRNGLLLIQDIAYRMAVLNPQLSGEVMKKTPGIVLIDEADKDLHVLWNNSFLNSLMRLFPKVQFVVTSRSMDIISSAVDKNLILLCKDGSHYYGKDLSGEKLKSVLYDVFGF